MSRSRRSASGPWSARIRICGWTPRSRRSVPADGSSTGRWWSPMPWMPAASGRSSAWMWARPRPRRSGGSSCARWSVAAWPGCSWSSPTPTRASRPAIAQVLGRVSRIASGPVRLARSQIKMSATENRGLVALGELVVASRHRAALLAAVHPPLHLVALPVRPRAKAGGRTPPAPADPVGPLVSTLRDVAGVAAPRGPVGPAGVGLVPGRCSRRIRGRPRPLGRAART